jgi:FkbM family methyltransferase
MATLHGRSRGAIDGRRRVWVALVALAVAGGACSREATTLYEQGPASVDGIGKRYMGREIAHVMGWQGAQWLERTERVDEERPDLLLPELGLKPGMVVADIGAGTGYYSWRMAQRVGEAGRVFAVDVQPEMIELNRRFMAQRGAKNVESVQSTAIDAKLAPGSIDLALMVDVYHEFEYPYEMLASVVRALKPGGRVVFVEYKGESPAVPIKPLHKMTEAQVRKEAAVHALEWVRTIATLPWQHAVVFRKR